jgi:NADH-quinone oxidoreductase subunit N
MVGFRKTSAFSIEAALKFFILGSLASVLFLFGSGMVYLAYGTFNLRDMTVFATYTLFKRSYALFAFGFSFILASFCFKLGLFPFHTWLPDVYDGAPMIVTFFLSVVSKIPLILVFLFFHHIFLTPFSFYFSSIFCFLSIFTIFFGSIGALFQVRLKRFLAYSSISQLGFIVLSLSYDYCMPLETFLLYTFVYLLLNLTLFICLMIFYIDFRTTKFTTSFSTIYDLSVCYDRNPFVSIIMVLSLFSLAGIPPLAGFVSKYYLIYTIIVLSNEMSLVWPMLVIMFVNTISVFYYVRLAGIILFGTANNDIVAQKGGEDVKVVSKPDKSNPEFQISYMLAFTLVFLFYFNVFFICSEKYIYFFIKLLFSLF